MIETTFYELNIGDLFRVVGTKDMFGYKYLLVKTAPNEAIELNFNFKLKYHVAFDSKVIVPEYSGYYLRKFGFI